MPRHREPPHEPAELRRELTRLREAVCAAQTELLARWRPHVRRRNFLACASNLAAYVALRRHDLRALQSRLADLGLSSLGRCEAHVLATLDAVLLGLDGLCGHRAAQPEILRTTVAMRQAERDLLQNTRQLLGPGAAHRWTRFMVTLPTEAASDDVFVKGLVERGMDCARINCAHDSPAEWAAMVKHVRKAAQQTGKPCKLLMDLAGPKLRTGAVGPGPAVLHLNPRSDLEGWVLRAARVILDASGKPGTPLAVKDSVGAASGSLAVEARWLARLYPGDLLSCRDLRGRKRELVVEERLSDTSVLARCERGVYFAPGLELEHYPSDISRKRSVTRVGAFLPAPAEIRVFKGDVLLLTRDAKPGAPARRDKSNQMTTLPHISCAQPEVFDDLAPGHAVWIDDGRIGALVEVVDEAGAWLRITRARATGERVAAEKGINFPDTAITLPALTAKDREDLAFAVEHADLVGYSFVRQPADIDALVATLKQMGGSRIGIIAKIETQQAVRNLPEIIVHGAGQHPFGVMIARGDLAVELGYERLAEIQEEILWLTEAARIPVIWATQVLESLVKDNRPSRAEITDAAMAERAECVMLNKGPYVFDALAVLDSVITRMQAHMHKKTARYRALHW